MTAHDVLASVVNLDVDELHARVGRIVSVVVVVHSLLHAIVELVGLRIVSHSPMSWNPTKLCTMLLKSILCSLVNRASLQRKISHACKSMG